MDRDWRLMAVNVSILDAYAIVHTGCGHRMTSSYYQGMPTQGLRYFFSYLVRELGDNRGVIVAFDFRGEKYFGNKGFNKSKVEGYKGQRVRDNSVLAQCKLAYTLCELAGIKCFKTPAMEGDSVVYNITELCKQMDDCVEIAIHSADYDLLHNVMFDEETNTNVKFVSVNSNAQDIDSITLSYGVYPGVKLLPNTISAYKTLLGDKSDNIKKFPDGDRLYQEFVDFTKNLGESLNPIVLTPKFNRTKEFFMAWVKEQVKSGRLTPEDFNQLQKRADTIFPKEFKDVAGLSDLGIEQFSPTTRFSVNAENLAGILKATGAKSKPAFLSTMLNRPINQTVTDVFKQAGSDLNSGRFSASIPRSTSFNTEAKLPEGIDLDFRGMIE